jgi:hypothetical protein
MAHQKPNVTSRQSPSQSIRHKQTTTCKRHLPRRGLRNDQPEGIASPSGNISASPARTKHSGQFADRLVCSAPCVTVGCAALP